MTGDLAFLAAPMDGAAGGASVFDGMADYFRSKEMQTRSDCANGRCAYNADGWVLSTDDAGDYQRCYGVLDGWDAMEGSISGAGCRHTLGAFGSYS